MCDGGIVFVFDKYYGVVIPKMDYGVCIWEREVIRGMGPIDAGSLD